MNNTVFKTAWGYALETALKYGITHNIPDHSTLNEALDFSADLTLAPGEKSEIGYMGIGSGGKNVSCSNNSAMTEYDLYHADQTKLYNHLPFILRAVDNDLTPTEAAKYRGRKVIDVAGTPYVAYYLKVLEKSTMAVEFETVTIPTNGPRTSVPYNTSASIQNPSAPTVGDIDAANNIYLSTHAYISSNLTELEVTEIKNASAIINGGVSAEYLTEIAIVSGVDKADQIAINGNTVDYTEVAKAQINEIVRIDKSLLFGNPDLDITLSAGALDPLYG